MRFFHDNRRRTSAMKEHQIPQQQPDKFVPAWLLPHLPRSQKWRECLIWLGWLFIDVAMGSHIYLAVLLHSASNDDVLDVPQLVKPQLPTTTG
jgi:type VI protein secretion system component VasF